MRLNEVFFTPQAFYYFNPFYHAYEKLLTQKVLRIALEIIVALCATHFFFDSLKFQIKVVVCLNCSLILVHMIADYFFKSTQQSPNIFSGDDDNHNHDDGDDGNDADVVEESRARAESRDYDFIDNLEVYSWSGSGSPFATDPIQQFTIGKSPVDERGLNALSRRLFKEVDEKTDE